MVKIQEAENQIVIDYEVYDHRPSDSDLLVPAIEAHQAALGRTPHLVAADAAFYSNKGEKAAEAKGVKRVCVPNRSTKSAARKHEQKKRWFRNGQNGEPDARDASAWESGDTVSYQSFPLQR
jgi:IS5 family transposase